MLVEWASLIVGSIALRVASKSYRQDERTAAREYDSDLLQDICLLYDKMDTLLTCPMTRVNWIGLCELVSDVEALRADLKTEAGKNRYRRTLSCYRRLYYSRIFNLPAEAYTTGIYNADDQRLVVNEQIVNQILQVRSSPVPIADEEVMMFLNQHFQFPRNYRGSTSFDKKRQTFLEYEEAFADRHPDNKDKISPVREDFERDVRMMRCHTVPPDGSFQAINIGRENGYSTVYRVARARDQGKATRLKPDADLSGRHFI